MSPVQIATRMCSSVVQRCPRLPLLLNSDAVQEVFSGSQMSRVFGVRRLKTLKVVLSEKIEGLGRAVQVVSMAPNYARNKLIPHRLNLPALPKYVTLVNNQLKGDISQRQKKGHHMAALPDDAPFALAIGASILSTLVLPVSADKDDKKEESLFGTDDVLAGAMQIISFIPLFNWLVWVFAWLDTRQPRYLAFSAIYLAPYLKTGLSLSPDDSWLPIASILACIVHVQLDISVNVERQSPLGDISKVALEKTQIKDLGGRADSLKNRFKGLAEKTDSRPMETAIQEDDQRKGAELKASQDEAQKKEFAEWDEKLARSKVLEEAAKEIDS